MKTILCFAAHPDDIEFSCVATLKKMKDRGHRIFYVVVTNGENGFKQFDTSAENRVRIRKEEQLKAAAALGVEQVFFMDYKDGFLPYSEELRRQLTGFIRQIKPEYVFCFDPANRSFDNLNLYHRDHRVLAETVFDSCFAARNKFMYPGESHGVERFYFFGTDQPNHIEDISSLIDFKLEQIACHASQFSDFPKIAQYVREKISPGREKYQHSEAFRVVDVVQIQKYKI